MQTVQSKSVPIQDWAILALATVAAMASMAYLWHTDPVRRLREAPSIGTVTSGAGVRRRRSGLMVWESLVDASSLYLRDTLVTPPGGSGVLTLNNGTKIEMGPDSMLQLKEVERYRFEATVFYGRAKSRPPPASKVMVALNNQAQTRQKTVDKTVRNILKKIAVISTVEELAGVEEIAHA
ncbi:MAG: hypothetical protein KDD51_16440, partial [Bdellovibrionales bacterium]|nr:hypothetical protein [Bdellovibrionales bacterium]